MNKSKQQGVVSLFIVIFTTLLLTVLVVGFLRIMIQEQKQAINQDLSQSAYDSAVSGVEDAKRVLRSCVQGDAAVCNKIDAGKCDTISATGLVSAASADSSETIINSDGTTTSLQQGYTCVLIDRQSPDYIGNLIEGTPQMVPLRVINTSGTTNGITKIKIEWMHKDNGAAGTGFAGGDPASLVQPTAAAGVSLPLKNGWSASSPAMLRVQAVLPPDASSVNLADLNGNIASTVFLRPSTINNAVNADISLPGLRATSGDTPVKVSPLPVSCSNDTYLAGGYACSVTLLVPASIGSVPLQSSVAFLRLDALYRNTSYRITVDGIDGPNSLKFDSVQPIVDSTGRAGNLYRRVSSRLDMSSFIVPPAGINITGSLCKDFYITDDTASSLGACSTNPS